VGRIVPKALLSRIAYVAVPLEDVEADHPGVALEPLLLVVEKGANRANVKYGDGL
jgi:hypothetical protein